jgi:hypothetical protein
MDKKMNRNRQHHPPPTSAAEPAVAAFCGDELGGRSDLRQILSRLGLRADEGQLNTLLELIHQSRSLRQRQSY